MRLPTSPLGIFLIICAVLVPAGAGLTAPVWLMVMGMRLDVAAAIGSRIVGVTALACAGLGLIYWLVLRPRILAAAPLTVQPMAAVEGPAEDHSARDRMVHTLVWCLFLLPFILIVVGFIVGQLDSVSGAD
ncbi:hypothetical protein CCC_02662 [Paramagnetospirillum magnetotacticum MS-1]|uniref:Uncharacterized protein n=1 Tax=Paramagnetospirillum magnetotacticum MS-1 TaxID=272627 RepID=A0A0C2YXN3_PARME|nr:hypothetical protein [Paramagnetospirillum magnetotacticum]KIL99873.1 hypothetical protein CCC_02662 [Paramagnetospirillum magnetotacticum MS-1]